LPFAGAFCLWLICLSLPSQRLCLPGCDRYYKAAKLAEALQREHHYTVDEKQKSVLLTEQGYEDAEDVLEVWVALGSVHLLISSPSGSVPRTAMF
jgi:preprotein translocase subunit SecA